MGLTPDTFKLPKIDLSVPDLFPGTPTWDRVGSDVFRALKEIGCFEAVHETLISPELHGSLMMKGGLIEELFGLPMEMKRRFVDSTMPLNGYNGGDPKLEPLAEAVGQRGRPQRERVAINGVLDSPVIRNMTDLLWPEGNSRFCDSLLNYARKISTLDRLVKRLVFEELGVQKYFNSHVETSFYTMRINKYAPANTEEEERLETRAHLDKSFLTILQQNQVNGLRVQTKEGEWCKVSFTSPSSFIVLVGESFVAWSNGRLRCPRHHVVMRGGETRQSIGMFSSVKGKVKCPEELVDEEHPLLFKPFEEIELYQFILTEEGRKPESTIKAYFGV